MNYKNIIRIVSMSLLPLAAALSVFGQETKDGQAGVRNLEVNRAGNSLNVAMSVDVESLAIGGDETVILTPVIVKDGHSAELPALEVMGRRAYIHFLRNDGQTITDNVADAVRSPRRTQPKLLEYSASMPYEKWMRGASLIMQVQSCGCNNTPIAVGSSHIDRILYTPYTPKYVLAFVEPDPEPVKTREESLSAFINFKVDKHDILVDYKNNASELASIVESVERVETDSDLTITEVKIEGWASPEAPEDYNLTLSQRRADALADYMADNTGINRAMIKTEGRGEDWINFRARVFEMTRLLDQDKVLAIIDNTTMSLDEKDKALSELIPPTIYQRLMNEVYPGLRRNDYHIIYNVRSFDVQEARAILDSNPKKLSLSEMYRVAGLYEKGSAEYNHVMEIAARTYPTNVAAAVNAAATMIEAGNYDGALALLEKAPADARILNARGVAYARRGDIEKAREAWKQASLQASAEADYNLMELEKSLE